MKKIFISYSYQDKDFVEWLKSNLSGLGLEFWYDQQEINIALTAYPEFDSYEEALIKPYLAPGNAVLPKERIMRAYLGGNHGGRKAGHFLPRTLGPTTYR